MKDIIVSSIVALLIIVCSTLTWLWHRERKARRMWHEDFLGEVVLCKQVERERDDARAQLGRVNASNVTLSRELHRVTTDNEAFVDAIDALQKEVTRLQKSADHATIPIADVPKRKTKSKGNVDETTSTYPTVETYPATHLASD